MDGWGYGRWDDGERGWVRAVGYGGVQNYRKVSDIVKIKCDVQ